MLILLLSSKGFPMIHSLKHSHLRQMATALIFAVLTVISLPLRTAQSAPVGSPVSVTRSITMTGSNITGLHYKDGVIWTTSYNNHRVERINATTGALIGSHIPVGANPGAPIEVNGHLFVPSAGSATVTDIDMSTATVTRTITLPGSNISSLNYDGTNIWALSFNGAHVQRFNPSTGALVGSTIPVGASPGMAIMADGHLFVSASGSNTVTDINMSTATVTRTITLSNSNISALHHDGTTLWASVFTGSKVARIDPATGTVLGYSATSSNPTNIISANGDIWVGSTGTANVTRINASTGAVIGNISQGGANISSLRYDGESIWATNFNNSYVSIIDAATGTVSATKPAVGSRPVVTLIVDNNVWVGSANSNVVTQISGPTPTTTTSTTTTTTTTTTTSTTTTTTVAPTTSTTVASSTTVAPTTTVGSSTTVAPTTTTAPNSPTTTNSPVVADSPVLNQSQPTTTSPPSTVRNAVATTTTTSSSTTTVAPTTTTSVPNVADVDSGTAAILVNGVETTANVRRENNQLLVSSAGVVMTLWAVTEDGTRVNLDEDGNLRVTESDQIEMSVSGLKARTDVEVWMFSTPTQLGAATTDTSGKASGRFKIPEGTPDGDHRFALESLLPNNEKATLAVGIVAGEVDATSTAARILIAIPILLAVAVGLIVPTTIRRRRQRLNF
jgi:Glutamine cyclotransferase